MKKFFKILGITVLILLVIIIVTPIFFKNKIMEIAKQQINNTLNAKVDFGSLSLSFIKNFPNASITLKDLYVAGIDDFEGDTLLKLKAFDVRVDIVSAIKMENINIKGILIDNPVITAKILPNGKVNWDIMKESEEQPEEVVDTTETEFTTKIALKKFEIRNAYIKYIDDSSKMSASLGNLNFLLKGDFSQDFTNLAINTTTESVNFIMDGIRYVKDAGFAANINLDADLKNSIYVLRENNIALNDLNLGFEGSVAMPNENDINVDMKFETKKNDFKSLLSMVPAVYMKDFESVKTSGELSLDGNLKGTYNESGMPNASLNLKVENAMFKYPDLPKSADNIQIDVDLFYDGAVMDNSVVNVNKFHVDLGGNPVDLVLNVKTPESDMNINGKFNINLDLATIADVIPLEGTTLKGKISSGIDFMGYMSYIEKEEYEKFKADGNLTIADFIYNSSDLPKAFKINETAVIFSPKYVEVKSFDAEIGKSDMQLSGKVENFIPYVFKDGTVKGNLDFKSTLLDLNEFLSESTEEVEETPEDTVPLTVFEVPKNVDFRLVSNLAKIFYDKLEIENTNGIISIKDGKVILENLSMNTLQGSLKLNGEYNTQDIKAPLVDFGIQANSIDIPSAYNAFGVIQKLAPIARIATGKVTIGMQYTSFLDEHMQPILNSIVGKGNLASSSIGITKSDVFSKLGDALKTKAFDNMILKDVNANFEIKNGRVYVEPFDTKMGQSNLVIGGDQGIDQSMNYNFKVKMPRSVLGDGANEAINNLYAQASAKGLNVTPSENINLDVKVGGTFSDPKISLGAKEGAKQSMSEIKEEIKEEVKEKVQEEVKKTVGDEAQKIMEQAEKEADIIRQQAREAAENVKKEANANADKLVKEAKNPVAKKAAEVTAKKMREEGESKANKMVKEADEKANKVIEEAKLKADKLNQ